MKNFLGAFLLLLFLRGTSQENIAPFTYQSLLLINPSFAGTNGLLRNQTAGFLDVFGPYAYTKRYSNSTDFYLRDIRAGIGVNVVSGAYTGYHKESSVSLNYAQHIKLGDNLRLIPSVQLNLLHLRIYKEYLYLGMLKTITYAELRPVQTFTTVNYSLLLLAKNSCAGVYLAHFTEPTGEIFEKNALPLSLTFHAAHMFTLNERNILRLSGAMINYETGTKIQRDLQLSAEILTGSHLIAGSSYYNRSGWLMLGYRRNFLNLSVSYGNTFAKRWIHSFGFAVTCNLRPKENRNQVTSFDAW
jgi:hypothetical protein